MLTESPVLDSDGQDVFGGLDVAKLSWKVSVVVGADLCL